MTGPEPVILAVMHRARYVPRQQEGGLLLLRVTPGAFTARGMPIPADRRQWNAYRLSGGKGEPYSASIDAHTRKRGSEIQPGHLIAIDCDTSLAADGSVSGDGFRELGELAAARGTALDLSGCVVVSTPGHGEHGPGVHLWWAIDKSRPVRPGPLPGHPLIEVKTRCTSPGSPGYRVRSVPDGELAVIPRWLSGLAMPPPLVAPVADCRAGGRITERLEGVVACLLAAGPGDGRNRLLFWAGCRCGEMIAAGELDRQVAERALFAAAEENGHVAKHGARATRGTIASGISAGMRQARVA